MIKDKKSNLYFFIVIIILTIGFLYIIIKKNLHVYPSDYAKIAPPMDFPVKINKDKITFFIPSKEIGKPHIVYVYDKDSLQYGMVDPSLRNEINITPDIDASYKAVIKDYRVKSYSILKTLNGYKENVNLYQLLLKAIQDSGKYGVQRCLNPFCNKCVEECKDVKGEDRLAVEIIANKRGELTPVYYAGLCPRCGRCFKECPVELIIQSGYFDEKVN